MSSRLNRPLRGANISSRAVINLALDTHVAVRGGSEHTALNELINAIRVSRLGPAGLGAVLLELFNDNGFAGEVAWA